MLTTPTGVAAQITGGIQQVGGTNVLTAGQFLQNIPVQTNGAQIVATPVTGPGGQISYNFVQQPQQVMALKVEGGGQVLTPIQSQPQVVQLNSGATSNPVLIQNGQVLQTANAIQSIGAATNIQNANAINLSNPASGASVQYMSVKQGNTVQMIPVIQQTPQVQTVPVQIPVGTLNGQTVFQSIQVPMQCIQPVLQASSSGIQLLPQQNVVDIPSILQGAQNAAQAAVLPEQQPNVICANTTTITKVTATPSQSATQGELSNIVSIKPDPDGNTEATDLTSKVNQEKTKPKRKSNEQKPAILNIPKIESSPEENFVQNLTTIQTIKTNPETLQQPMVQTGVQPTHVVLPNGQIVQSSNIAANNNAVTVMTPGGLQTIQGVQLLGDAQNVNVVANESGQLVVQGTSGAQVSFENNII